MKAPVRVPKYCQNSVILALDFSVIGSPGIHVTLIVSKRVCLYVDRLVLR